MSTLQASVAVATKLAKRDVPNRRRPGSPHSYSGLVTPVAPVALVAPPLPVPTLQLPRLRRLLPRLPRKPEQEELKKQIKDYLAKGVIEPSSSPYAAPILFVQKKSAGYHQIRITPEDVPKTAFRTPEGHFQFKVLSFGLTNAPATFQRVMNDAFAPVLGKCALVYLDDILVMSKSLPDHMQHLRLVFDLLRANKLFAKMSKCEFMQLTLKFLGHVITAGAISVDPDKVRAVADWPLPSSLTQLQSFLGAANFVRKFVQGFSAISAPLTDLCGKLSATFPWHSWPDHERLAFHELKSAVANVPMLRLPDHAQSFQVYCHASLQGVGAVLMQDGYPLAYLSKKLSSAEVNYTTDGTPTGETPGAGTSTDPENFRGLLALARTDPDFRRDLQAALNPAGTSANHSRPGTGPLDDELLNDEEEVEDEEPDENEEEEDEAEQLREELAATRMELNSLRIRQRNMDRALSSLAAQVSLVPGRSSSYQDRLFGMRTPSPSRSGTRPACIPGTYLSAGGRGGALHHLLSPAPTSVPAAKAVPGPDKWTDACAKSVRRASAFCDDLEAHCARYSLDIVSVFPAFLSGAARNAWYPSVQQAHFAQTGVAPPWQFLRASFLEYTGDDLRDDMLEARDRLLDRSIRMGPSYPELSEYLIAFRNNLLTAGAQCMDESLLVNLFVTGLSPSLRETVLKDIVPLQNPTLTQAIDSARQAQRNAVFLAGAVSSKRHVAAVQGRAITEQAEHEITDANRPLPLSGRQPIAPRPAGRTAPRRGGMRPGPPPAAAGKKSGAAAAATAVKPGQYCHHCYSPDHLKPQCPWKHLPAKQAREQSGYSRPPAGANVPQKRSRPDDDDKGQGKGKLATANAK
ncbi:hypothetical protein QJQ45_011667 [Haematococcus lacustris]|nr:hypothetical protein QJQ45_011667 [Haematococcus lacustris]